MTRNETRPVSRRTVLRTAAGTVAVGAVAVPVASRGDDPDVELGARTSGWVGRSPGRIADERNPTLELVEGEAYTLRWVNEDGAGHNFVVEGEGEGEGEDGDERFVETELVSVAGETQTVSFTAREGMTAYFCGPHPRSMRGEISFAGDETDETHALTVTVEDRDGRPVEGATVRVTAADGGAEGEDDVRDEDEDPEDLFLDPPDEGNEGDENGEDSVTEDGGDDGEDGAREPDEHEKETDADGVAEFEDLGDGDYEVVAEHDDDEAEGDVTVEGDDEAFAVTLDVDGGEGADDDEDGRPPPGIRSVHLPRRRSDGSISRTGSDTSVFADGHR